MVTSCRFCGGPPADTIETREMMFGLRHPFTYRRCGSCASLWLETLPDDLSVYYGNGYYSMAGDPKGANPSSAASIWARTLLRLPSPIIERTAGKRGFPRYLLWALGLGLTLNSRIADVGSGEGSVISQMSRHGFTDLWGFDPFIAADRDVGNARYRKATIHEAPGSFDLIMFNHSLEHTPDPLADLQSAAEHLAPAGTIVVRIPVANSYADRHYGKDWVALDPPRHLAIPSREGMAVAAKAAGLHVGRVFFDSQPLQFWASEHYQEDVPLCDQEPPSAELRNRARALNKSADGDTAGFVLRAARTPR